VSQPVGKVAPLWKGHHGRVHVSGFTLIELMVVVTIVGVIMLVAAPSYNTLTERTRLKSYANELVSSFYLARSEAIKRNDTMTLCVSTDGIKCTGGGEWEQGWIVFDDNDPLDDTDNLVVKQQQPLPDGLVLFNLSSSTFTAMDFLPSGLVDIGAPVQMKLCKQTPSAGVEEKIVRFTLTGSPSIKTNPLVGCP
jgi:type IV fimbrial biogenesis protein FimT